MKRLSNRQFQQGFNEQLKRDNDAFRMLYEQDKEIKAGIKALKERIAEIKGE